MNSRFSLIPILALCALPAYAHTPRYGIATGTRISFHENEISLTLQLSYHAAWARNAFNAADRNGDKTVQSEEAEAFVELQWNEHVSSNLKCKLDGKEITLKRVKSWHENLGGQSPPLQFSVNYKLFADFPPGASAGGAQLELTDHVYRGERPETPHFTIPVRGQEQAEIQLVQFDWLGERDPEVDRSGFYLFHQESVKLQFKWVGKKFSELVRNGTPPHLQHTALTPCNCSGKFGIAPASEIVILNGAIQVTYNLAYIGRWAVDAFHEMDTNRDDIVQDSEAIQFMESTWRKKIRRHLKCEINGHEPGIELDRSLHFGLTGKDVPDLFNIWYVFTLHPEGGLKSGKPYRLSIQDDVSKGTSPQSPVFLVPILNHPIAKTHTLTMNWKEPESPIVDKLGLFAARNDSIVLEFSLRERTE
ncbi:MAG: hypothetical protein O3B01_26560 [Planctomycetota bacterium]|nr:hypothetical protein [Planctomycetota bacterium]